MADEARHHHYVPQGYLRGFGFKRSKHWMVVAHDLENKKVFETNTRNVCGERDFMRYEMEGERPDRLENELAHFEGQAIEAIRRVAASGEFAGEDRNLVLNLMALLAVRSPEQREAMREFHEEIAKRIMDLTLADKRRWEGQMSRMKAAGKSVNADVTYEQAKEFHERGEYTVTVPRERHIGVELDSFGTVLELLGKRVWTLYITDGSDGEFITTNRPVVNAFLYPERVPPLMRNSPGFALSDTRVTFPLTKHALLIGRWDGKEGTIKAEQAFIGAINNQMIRHSFGLVLGCRREVLYHDPLMRLRWDANVIESFTIPPSKEEQEKFLADHQHILAARSADQ